MSPTPYTIAVPDSKIDRLNDMLGEAILNDEVETDNQWKYGSPLSDVERLVGYWKNEYNWRETERKLNELPNYQTSITAEGFHPLDIHFVHKKSNVVGAIPLLFVHGWPGSFIEVTKILPLLAGEDGNVAFHVVAPSLPNYGFSSGVKKGGFGIESYAEVCHKLMLQLGYDEYVTQGGDWGSIITREMTAAYPDHVKAAHINLVLAGPPTFSKNPLLALQHMLTPYSAADKEGIARSQDFRQEGMGYNILQRTKPQTVGYGLASSPVFVLAWIYEKLHDWTDSYPWTDDEICTWVSIYWFSTAGPAASVRIYYEASHVSGEAVARKYIPNVPLGLGRFPKEILVVPKTWARALGNVVYEGDHEDGGHFAAWERPHELVKDLRNMFKKGGPCYRVVKGKDGYAGSPQTRL